MKPLTNETLIEEFERAFSQKHGSNHHTFANDGKRSKDCEVCQDDRKYNPKGYYLTFLSEKQCYWTREMMNDVKAFILSAIQAKELAMVEKFKEMIGEDEDVLVTEGVTFKNTTAASRNELRAYLRSKLSEK